jgi:RimJ/RimL family protein N-acetyltransferase
MSALLPILTERLELRALRLEDAAPLFRDVYGDPDVMRWVAGGTLPDVAAAEAAVQRFITHQRAHGYSWWALVERASGDLIGDGGLYSYEDRGPGVELGYTLARRAWGRGFATETALACLDVAFGPLGIDRVTAVARPENHASQHVLGKAGMRRDGIVDYFGNDHVRFVADARTWRRP